MLRGAVASAREKRTRGPNRRTPWRRDPADGLSVLRLALDTTDPVERRRVEAMFAAAYSVRRALQRDAGARARPYWRATRARGRDPAAVRERFSLSRTAFAHAAYGHLDGAPHLRRAITKALVMHLADGVWTDTKRHLFRDASGRRHGPPRVGRWYDFRRIPGRARSRTTANKWETFRLHGSLAGHRAAYTRAKGRFVEPRRLRRIDRVAAGSWWSYTGPLALVFTGLPGGDLVLPVRLPAAPANQPILDHHLADPTRWHKVDLVRRRDPNAAGGWRYEAHLMVLVHPYVGPTTAARREVAATNATDRRAGIDVNVSNVTVASHAAGADLQITRVERDAGEKARAGKRSRRERRLARELERSRRALNPAQYALSPAQEARARERATRGLRPREVIPRGPRRARAGGRPVQAYRKDRLSRRYRRRRAAQAAGAASAAQARRDHARQIAGALVRQHGVRFTIEDCDLRAWARRWGRALAAFSPGTLVAALEREAHAVATLAGVAGGLDRAATQTTALSQHCLCGAPVAKALAERVHDCPRCGLVGDRDAVAASLAAFVVFATPGVPRSATIDVEATRAALDRVTTRTALAATLPFAFPGRQDAPSESTALSARDGSSVAWSGRTSDREVVMARRTVGMAPRPTPDEPGRPDQTTPDRARTRTNLHRSCGPPGPQLRDSS